MSDFMAHMNIHSQVAKAIAKYAQPGLDQQDMDLFDFTDAAVIKKEAKEGKLCYTAIAFAKLMKRTYLICWKEKKITSIEDQGIE